MGSGVVSPAVGMDSRWLPAGTTESAHRSPHAPPQSSTHCASATSTLAATRWRQSGCCCLACPHHSSGSTETAAHSLLKPREGVWALVLPPLPRQRLHVAACWESGHQLLCKSTPPRLAVRLKVHHPCSHTCMIRRAKMPLDGVACHGNIWHGTAAPAA